METLKFKTTIKCAGCISKVTSFLNQAAGENNWEVDITNPEKILTIKQEHEHSEQEILDAVQKAGYKAEKIN